MNEELYLVAYKDIEQKEIDEALWLKAMSHASGDKKRAKWSYIELRVEQMTRDPSLRRSASKKIRKPNHQSGAYMIWISIIFCFTIISAAITLNFGNLSISGNLSHILSNALFFFNWPSLIFILPVAILFGISATSWRTYGRCWTYTLGSAKHVSIQEASSVVRCLNVMGNVAWKMGILGTLIGIALLLKGWNEINNIGTALTVASLTLFYGILFKLLTYVAEQRIRNHYIH